MNTEVFAQNFHDIASSLRHPSGAPYWNSVVISMFAAWRILSNLTLILRESIHQSETRVPPGHRASVIIVSEMVKVTL